jgi:hypothetical protein
MSPNPLAPVVLALIHSLRDERIAHEATREVLRGAVHVLHGECLENERTKSRYSNLLAEYREVRSSLMHSEVA